MNLMRLFILFGTLPAALFLNRSWAATRTEHFDRAPLSWEGVNNRNTNFSPKRVTQDFGYFRSGKHFGNAQGEIGGTINPAGEPAYYGYRLPAQFSLENPQSASGKLL